MIILTLIMLIRDPARRGDSSPAQAPYGIGLGSWYLTEWSNSSEKDGVKGGDYGFRTRVGFFL